MAVIKKGNLRGFYKPDYDGGSIVNLLASVILARGGFSPHKALAGCCVRHLDQAERIVYLLVDGLGKHQLDAYLNRGCGRSFFSRHPHEVVSTVFPATTAAAVTTCATGSSPAEHGVLSWWLNLHDLGVVGNVLLEKTRTGAPMDAPGFDLRDYLKLPSYLDGTSGGRALLSYGHIPESALSNAGTEWNSKECYRTLEGLKKSMMNYAHSSGERLAYAYWPELDACCHEYGCFNSRTLAHFDAIDSMLACLADELRGTGTVLLVTSDHGLVDCPDGCFIDLSKVDGLYDCLATLPSGDARQVSFFVRPSRRRDFLNCCSMLDEAGVLVRGQELIRMGIFGPGRSHPSLSGRVGDYVLIARNGFAFEAPPSGFQASALAGYHGGMSRDEMLVPVYTIDTSDRFPPDRFAL